MSLLTQDYVTSYKDSIYRFEETKANKKIFIFFQNCKYRLILMVWKLKISFATDGPNYGLMAIRYVIEYF